MPSLNGNYIDLIIIVVLLYFATEAFRHGFWVLLADFIAFFGSLVLSLRTYKYISNFFKLNFNLTSAVSNALGFLLSAVIVESLLAIVLGFLLLKIPEKVRKHKLNKFLGIFPGLGEGIILVSFLLTLVMAFPIKPNIKNDITNSKIGSFLLEKTVGAEGAINEVFGGVINDSLTYLTIHPASNESVSLDDVLTLNLSVDENAEEVLFKKVNEERRKLAIEELAWNPEIVPVARSHAKDMWERKYFSHYSPEGKDVGDRLLKGGVDYQVAGENLALAPTVSIAHTGLMNSEGHRENILNPEFHKIGIGVIDNGIYGKMFVQVFTD